MGVSLDPRAEGVQINNRKGDDQIFVAYVEVWCEDPS